MDSSVFISAHVPQLLAGADPLLLQFGKDIISHHSDKV